MRTGVTVLLADNPIERGMRHPRWRAGDARRPPPLDAISLVGQADAIVLSGGSAFGLDAPAGVTSVLRAQGRGFEIAPGAPRVPIVPGAILFDLVNGGERTGARNLLIARWALWP